MPADPFTAQRRVDDFRAGLGSYGGWLIRGVELDDLLDEGNRNGWDAAKLGNAVALALPASISSGTLITLKLREQCRRPEPAPIVKHALDAARRQPAEKFRQPKAPCGVCDGTPARWMTVTMPDGYTGQTVVKHCPFCWTEPPGYVYPHERNRRQLASIYGLPAP